MRGWFCRRRDVGLSPPVVFLFFPGLVLSYIGFNNFSTDSSLGAAVPFTDAPRPSLWFGGVDGLSMGAYF